jgi:hypothetical protein
VNNPRSFDDLDLDQPCPDCGRDPRGCPCTDQPEPAPAVHPAATDPQAFAKLFGLKITGFTQNGFKSRKIRH